MKKLIDRLYCCLVLTMLITIHGCKKNDNSICNCNSITQAADRYAYPVKPGSVQWNAAGAAGGFDSLYKLSQVPQPVLSSMTTLGLIQTLEDNPMLFNMFLRDNKFFGRNEVLSRLNVSWTLNSRNDAATTIVNYYNQKSPCCVEKLSSDTSKGEFANKWYLFDMICTQDSILNQLDAPSRKNFARIIIEKYLLQTKYPATFGSSKTSSCLLLSQVMLKASYTPYVSACAADSSLNDFTMTGISASLTILETVLHHAKLFITN